MQCQLQYTPVCSTVYMQYMYINVCVHKTYCRALLAKIAEISDDTAVSWTTLKLFEGVSSLLQTSDAGEHLFKLLLWFATKALNNLTQEADNWLQQLNPVGGLPYVTILLLQPYS